MLPSSAEGPLLSLPIHDRTCLDGELVAPVEDLAVEVEARLEGTTDDDERLLVQDVGQVVVDVVQRRDQLNQTAVTRLEIRPDTPTHDG